MVKSAKHEVLLILPTANAFLREEHLGIIAFLLELDEIKYFIRKPKAIEDLVNHVATILG